MEQALLAHVLGCNNAVLPGGRSRLLIGAHEVGWVAPAHAPAGPLADAASFARHVEGLAFRRRGEAFDVRDDASGQVVAQVDRGAVPLLGITAVGVHMNGLVQRADGPHLWVGRRAADRALEPGKLDHLVAGGVPAGMDARQTLLKEAAEEASLPAGLVAGAVARGGLRYAMERPGEGLRRDELRCFDLWLPDEVQPVPGDDEVAGFELMPVTQAMRLAAETDAFKFNVALVLVDLFLRLGLLAEGGPCAAAIRQLRTA